MGSLRVFRNCIICGKTEEKNNGVMVAIPQENFQLGLAFVCDDCISHLESGGVFKKAEVDDGTQL